MSLMGPANNGSRASPLRGTSLSRTPIVMTWADIADFLTEMGNTILRYPEEHGYFINRGEIGCAPIPSDSVTKARKFIAFEQPSDGYRSYRDFYPEGGVDFRTGMHVARDILVLAAALRSHAEEIQTYNISQPKFFFYVGEDPVFDHRAFREVLKELKDELIARYNGGGKDNIRKNKAPDWVLDIYYNLRPVYRDFGNLPAEKFFKRDESSPSPDSTELKQASLPPIRVFEKPHQITGKVTQKRALQGMTWRQVGKFIQEMGECVAAQPLLYGDDMPNGVGKSAEEARLERIQVNSSHGYRLIRQGAVIRKYAKEIEELGLSNPTFFTLQKRDKASIIFDSALFSEAMTTLSSALIEAVGGHFSGQEPPYIFAQIHRSARDIQILAKPGFRAPFTEFIQEGSTKSH